MEDAWGRTLSENESKLARSFAIIVKLISKSKLLIDCCANTESQPHFLPAYSISHEVSQRKLLAETIAIQKAVLQELEDVMKTIDTSVIELTKPKER